MWKLMWGERERAMEAKGQGHSRQQEGEESEESPQLLLEWIPDCSHTEEQKVRARTTRRT